MDRTEREKTLKVDELCLDYGKIVVLCGKSNLDGGDHARVGRQHGQRAGRLETPHANRAVAAARRQQAVVEADGEVGHFTRVAAQRRQQPTRDVAPDFYQFVVGALQDEVIG